MKRKILFLILSVFILSVGAKEHQVFHNPILTGFYPDPSIVRVQDTYYMVNSSFEWYPGLPIHKSKDLVNWELVGYAVSRPSQITFNKGLADSGGMFAPTIRYHNGKFYVICTAVGAGGNFIVTASDPAGEWSDPIWIKSVGIDPSLYWEDGKCYYLGAGCIDKATKDWYGQNGVYMQEINTETGELIGKAKQLTHGHAINARWTEGPHLYKINGKYLLMVSEGGTSEFHALTVFSSEKLWGPYIANQVNPVMTHRNLGYTYPIIQTGHGDLFQTQDGHWYCVLLAKRPIEGNSMLARETFLAKVEMTTQDGEITPIFNPGKGLLQLKQKRPDLPWSPVAKQKIRDYFKNPNLDLKWNFLRTPTSSWYKLKDDALILDLRPEKLSKKENPSYLAQRTKYFYFECSTKLEFITKLENEQAGLVAYRNSYTHYKLLKGSNYIKLIKTYDPKFEANPKEIHSETIAEVPYNDKEVVLKVRVEGLKARFYYGSSKKKMKQIGVAQDYSILGDEKAKKFNGNFLGMYASSNGEDSNKTAKFYWFEQKPLEIN